VTQNSEAMTEARAVRHVSVEWDGKNDLVRICVDPDRTDQPRDLLLASGEVQALILMLLTLSGKAGGPSNFEGQTVPIEPDAVGIGETPEGAVVLQLGIGRTALAFALPSELSRRLGQSLLTYSASPTAN
jgi:hypothetical protein